jgi:hypothetical protein
MKRRHLPVNFFLGISLSSSVSENADPENIGGGGTNAA